MRVLRLLACFLFPVVLPCAFAQSTALKVEPACPVAGPPSAVGTAPLHITYFPQARDAQIKSPQELVLKVAVNGPTWRNNTRSVPFTRKGDAWEATLSQGEKDVWLYLMFMAKDEKTGQVDDNGGRYWDLLFCIQTGQLHFQAIEAKARSYTGVVFDNGIARSADLAKAAATLEEHLGGADPTRFNVLLYYWEYKVQRDGGNEEAWQKLAAEIDQFLDDHRTEMPALTGASNFIRLHEDRLPPQLFPKMMGFIQAMDASQAAELERMASFSRIQREKDRRNQAEQLAEFARKYAKHPDAKSALAQRFQILRDLGDLSGAEAAFQQRVEANPDWPDTYAAMAALYVQNKMKLEEALKLLDKAEELAKPGQQEASFRTYLVLSPDPLRTKATLAYWRVRAYLEQHKGERGLPLLEKILAVRNDSDGYFTAGQVFEAAGQRQKALDAYLQAVIQPSKKHAEQVQRLERLWGSGGLGTGEPLQKKIQSLEAQRFKDAHYVPQLADIPAPEFEFVTLKGEKFRSVDLREKTVVLNFWATWCGPCIPELAGFQLLQEKHPELLVAALAIGSEDEGVKKIIGEQKLSNLRIARADSLKDAFVPQGVVPITYVISRDRIRVVHGGAVEDVVAYLEADLGAVEKSAITK